LVIVSWLALLAIISCIPAVIAQNKGRSFGGWWLYGFLVFPIALIHSLVTSKNIEGLEQRALDSGNRKCPSCAEMVKVEAKVCKHCGNDLEPYVAEVDPNASTAAQQTIGRFVVVGGLLVLGIIFYAITN
jgi:hypothetical protein